MNPTHEDIIDALAMIEPELWQPYSWIVQVRSGRKGMEIMTTHGWQRCKIMHAAASAMLSVYMPPPPDAEPTPQKHRMTAIDWLIVLGCWAVIWFVLGMITVGVWD